MNQFKAPRNASDVAQCYEEMRRIALALSQHNAPVGLLSATRKEIGKEAMIASLEDTLDEARIDHEAPTSRVLAAIPRTVTMETAKVEKRA